MLHVRICAGGRPQGRSLPRHSIQDRDKYSVPGIPRNSDGECVVSSLGRVLVPEDGVGGGERGRGGNAQEK
jgi:hypothetical protein